MLKSLLTSAQKLAAGGSDKKSASVTTLFPKTDPAVDGADCLHDCDSCTTHYPRSFKIDEGDHLYGQVKGWESHLLVATGKTDWVRDVADEKGSIMQAVDQVKDPLNGGRLMLSASNIPTPNHSSDYAEPTRVLLLPAFVFIDNVTPPSVPDLLHQIVSKAPTTSSPLIASSSTTATATAAPTNTTLALPRALSVRPCPHSVLVLLCSQKTRDARCGQSAPLIRKELERHLRPLGLYRDLDDERPGGVGIYFISHVGGHKYSANMIIYRRPDAFGIDNVHRAELSSAEQATLPDRIRAVQPAVFRAAETATAGGGGGEEAEKGDAVPEADADASAVGASQGIWLARVKPEDCENLVKYTILQGKVVKPESQLRGGFDREKGILSW